MTYGEMRAYARFRGWRPDECDTWYNASKVYRGRGTRHASDPKDLPHSLFILLPPNSESPFLYRRQYHNEVQAWEALHTALESWDPVLAALAGE